MSLAALHNLDDRPTDEAPLAIFSVLAEDGQLAPEAAPLVNDALLVRMHAEMKKIRLLDQRMILLQRQGRVGFYGACTGQEAAAVAAGLAASAEDWIFPGLRENGILLVRGFALASYVAQIYGNGADASKGRQMPSHVSARSAKQVSWSSCIGTQLPHAVGVALAAKLKNDPVVTLGFLGDGATSAGDFHAAMNFAAVLQVPTVFVCQNNQWAISVPLSRQTASSTLAIKGRAYGMRNRRVDGNDVVAVYLALSDALARARAGKGPMFIELLTYRVAPHSTSDDPSRYRSADEVEKWTRKDPLERLSRHLFRRGLLTADADKKLEEEFVEQIAEAIAEVEAHGPPDLSTLFEDVYAETPWHLIEQRELMQRAVSGRPLQTAANGATTSAAGPLGRGQDGQ